MTDLREEIRKYLDRKFSDQCINMDAGAWADNICKLFEQRVESIKNENTPKILEYILMDSNEKALFTGYHKALEEVKEILKEK